MTLYLWLKGDFLQTYHDKVPKRMTIPRICPSYCHQQRSVDNWLSIISMKTCP